MSNPVIKGLKRSASRPSSRTNASASSSAKSSAKNRTLASKSAKSKLDAKRTVAEKAPARKAAKSKTAPAAKEAPARAPGKTAPKAAPPKAAPKSGGKAAVSASAKPAREAPARPAKSSPAATATPAARPTPPAPAKTGKTAATTPAAQQALRQTRDEAAALRAFERAHREFSRGSFGEARSLFAALIHQYPGVSEVTARARTYLAIADSRLRSDASLPRDADSLYDRGVIELNRGEYVAAQEMFERALKREPEAAHIHYGLAATRARLGSIELALNSLERALDLQPTLRVRAQHDQDLTSLRNEPDFERLIFSQR